MESGERMRHLRGDITVQVERGGVTQTLRGLLNRSSRRSRLSSWRKVRGHLLEGGRSLAAFVSGLLLASLYGAAALFLQNQPLWFCVHTTLAIAGLAAFSMGLSAGVRVVVMVMLPSLCSAHGRKFILVLFVSVLLSGPLANTLENTERAASSLMCAAELAANQTQELMQRAATPLFSVLDKVREITSNAYAVAGRVQNFIHALTDSVRHVARTLRNVLHFLVDIGDICNAKLGSPYRKCRAVFAEAHSDCSDLLGDFDFLCDIVDGFLPLCEVARAAELFCIIPSYVAAHLRKRLAEPVVAAFEKMKREFEFDVTASVNFDLDANSSRAPQQVTQDIVEEVSSQLHVFQRLSEPLAYGGLVLLALSFLRAVQYRCSYLRDLDFDNIYITAQFVELDQQVTSEGGASILPITRREAKTYITPLSFHMTSKEQRTVVVGVVSVLRHLVIGGLLVALDFLVFWILDQVHHQVKGEVVARAPVTVVVQVTGSGYASDIFRDLVSSFNVLQGGNITVISRRCLLEPSEPNPASCYLLGFLLGLSLLVSLSGGLVQRCRRLICAACHPERELERIRYLRQQILDQRRAVGRALRRSAFRRRAERGGGGGGGCRLQTLLRRFPGGRHLSRLLVLSSPDTCLSCGDVVTPGDDSAVPCDIACDDPRCSALFCRPCFHSLGNTCVVCTRPLTFQEDSEEELEQLTSAALTKGRISMATRRSDGGVMEARDGDGGGGVSSDSELSEADMTYQDRPASDESDSDASSASGLQDLDAVLVDKPDGPQNLQDSPGPFRTL